MQVSYSRCAGLDVHKDTIVVCVRCVPAPVHHEVQSFPSTTNGLLALSDWLTSHRCTHVAMEAAGVYWKPFWDVLEDSFELVLGNAARVRNVPGRKKHVNDAMWIAGLLAHGCIGTSFMPPAAIQELRDLTRTRKQLAREIAEHCLRIQSVLEDANLKLGSVLSDGLGGIEQLQTEHGLEIASVPISNDRADDRHAKARQQLRSVARTNPTRLAPRNRRRVRHSQITGSALSRRRQKTTHILQSHFDAPHTVHELTEWLQFNLTRSWNWQCIAIRNLLRHVLPACHILDCGARPTSALAGARRQMACNAVRTSA